MRRIVTALLDVVIVSDPRGIGARRPCHTLGSFRQIVILLAQNSAFRDIRSVRDTRASASSHLTTALRAARVRRAATRPQPMSLRRIDGALHRCLIQARFLSGARRHTMIATHGEYAL